MALGWEHHHRDAAMREIHIPPEVTGSGGGHDFQCRQQFNSVEIGLTKEGILQAQEGEFFAGGHIEGKSKDGMRLGG